MSSKTNNDRKAVRRQETIDEIVSAAWELSAEQGLVGFSLRDLGARVGMRAQSLYSYFGSKNEIYDAMFLDGNQALIATLKSGPDAAQLEADPVDVGRAQARIFFEFCIEDPVRYQLLFQRTIPGFDPSPESYAAAEEAYELGPGVLRAVGLSQADLDLWTAVLTGLVSQQLSNDPGGDRWAQVFDRAIDMLLAENTPELLTEQGSHK